MLLLYLRIYNQSRIWLLFIFYGLASILMFLASSMVLPQKNNIIEYDVLLLLASVFISLYFYFTLREEFKKYLALGTLFAGVTNFVQRNIVFVSNAQFDSVGFYVFSVLVVIMIFMYFNQALKTYSKDSILLSFDFWINISLLIYYTGAMIIFLSIYALSGLVKEWQDHLSIGSLWAAQNIFLFLSSLCITSGVLWVNYQKK